jgi:hypothetical protein
MKTKYMKPELTVVIMNNPYLLNNASLPEGTGYTNTPVLSKGGSMLWSDDDFAYDDYEDYEDYEE